MSGLQDQAKSDDRGDSDDDWDSVQETTKPVKIESVNLAFAEAVIRRSQNKGMYDDDNVETTKDSKKEIVVAENVNDNDKSNDNKVDYYTNSIFNTYTNFGYNRGKNNNNSKGNTSNCDKKNSQHRQQQCEWQQKWESGQEQISSCSITTFKLY